MSKRRERIVERLDEARDLVSRLEAELSVVDTAVVQYGDYVWITDGPEVVDERHLVAYDRKTERVLLVSTEDGLGWDSIPHSEEDPLTHDIVTELVGERASFVLRRPK